MIICILAVGAVVGAIGGKYVGPKRHAGYLPYIPAGMIGAIIVGFIVRGAFGADELAIGNFIAIAASAGGAAAFIALAHALPVRQTLPH